MRILCVEDNPQDALLMHRALSRPDAGMTSWEAVPTLAAAREALVEPLRFDLVLTDLNLPDGSGMELVTEIRRRELPLAVVTLTGAGDEELVLAALRAGADDYMAKSGDLLERLPTAVREAWAAFQDRSARLARSLHVLYVEHNALDADLARRHLEARAPHIQLEWVSSAPAALERLPRSPQERMPFDVLLVDFRLAGDSGLDLLKAVRQDRGLDVPVVLVTGQGSEEVAAMAMRLGATDYLVKRSNHLLTLPAVLEGAHDRVQAAHEHAALRTLNQSLERRVAERTAELEAAKAVAEAANRAKSDFLARMSHDLRTPLNAVLGFSDLLARNPRLVDAPDARRQVGLIHEAGKHLLAMIDDVLDVARIEAGGLRLKMEQIDPEALIQDCLPLVEQLSAQHRIMISAVPSSGRYHVQADRTRLRQVLVNLLSNAIKYNRPGGQVSLQVAPCDAGVRLDVTDDGLGLTPQELDSLFQPFKRGGAEGSAIEGTGLGLVITKGLVEAMQGQILVRSTPGAGSTFSIVLPLAKPQDPAAGREAVLALPDPRGLHALRQHRVLYVEDNAVNATLMSDMLQTRPDIELKVAPDGPSALALASSWRPQLVLLDLGLPGMSGIDVLRRLRADAATAAVPCVAVSAYALGPEIQQALDEGCAAYLTKPFDIQDLLAHMDRHLR